ncbi:hypothetical protein PRIC1_002692 [Phytophthora ramorum]|nr:hypothetical protein KRP22_614 [Phytophthora ramorum]
MVLSRTLVLLCVAAAVVLSEAPGAGVSAELVPRQLEEEVVKVHVKVSQNPVAPQPQTEEKGPLRKHSHKHHKKQVKEEVSGNSETVRDYAHGTVRIDSKGSKAAKQIAKTHHRAKKDVNDESVVEYQHGSVKISGKKDDEKEKSSKKKAALNEKEVTSTANDVNELVTKLSSTTSAENKSFIDAYGPVVVICGIIGGIAAIVGVAGLVMDQPQSSGDNLDSVLDDSADLDVDVEANITSAGVQEEDVAADGEDLMSDSDSDAYDDEEEEGTFANTTAHVSV